MAKKTTTQRKPRMSLKKRLPFYVGVAALVGAGLGAGICALASNSKINNLEANLQKSREYRANLRELLIQRHTLRTADILCDTIPDRFYVVGRDTLLYEVDGVRISSYFAK